MKESLTQLQVEDCIDVHKWKVIIIMLQHFVVSSSQALSKGDHDQGENIADNGGSKVKSLFHLVKNIYTAAANSIPGSVPGLQKVTSC